MPAQLTPLDLAQWLLRHPQIVEAHFHEAPNGPMIQARYDREKCGAATILPQTSLALPIAYTPSDPITDLRLRTCFPTTDTPETRCQNEPVHLGTQIQPRDRNWVGTAGSPVRYWLPDETWSFGLLTNWHVLPGGDMPEGWPVHQPTQAHPTLAHLHDWKGVDPSHPNYVDAAFADSFINGFHTTSDSILGVGTLHPDPAHAAPALAVSKVGRTTGLTTGECTHTGAAVRVNYGDFEAVFADQDLFESPADPFSAAGDSGSLIFCYKSYCPVALLFAGGGGITVGNPIRHVLNALPIDFAFP